MSGRHFAAQTEAFYADVIVPFLETMTYCDCVVIKLGSQVMCGCSQRKVIVDFYSFDFGYMMCAL